MIDFLLRLCFDMFENTKERNNYYMNHHIKIEASNFIAVHTAIQNSVIDGTPVIRIIKQDKIDQYDENTYARLNNLQFHNGTIEVKMLSRLLPDAPDFARGFIGIVYRANTQDSEFESFYVRPTNGRRCDDPVRKSHGCQYFSYPGYTFSYFREFNLTKYEAPVNLALDEWFTLKAVVENGSAEFYLNGEPALSVNDMKHGKGDHGAIGIFVDIGTEAFISDLKITCTD